MCKASLRQVHFFGERKMCMKRESWDCEDKSKRVVFWMSLTASPAWWMSHTLALGHSAHSFNWKNISDKTVNFLENIEDIPDKSRPSNVLNEFVWMFLFLTFKRHFCVEQCQIRCQT